MNNLSKILGERLVTIGELAEETGLSRSTISAIYHRKNKNVKLGTLKLLCDYLKVPLSTLVDYDPNVEESNHE